MLIRWQQEDAQQWAHFSGDNNPVHFDDQYARAMGCDGTIVHGMRAMLDIKKTLAERVLLNHPQAYFYRFNARLRRPLVCNTAYRLAVVDKSGGSEAKLVAAEDNSGCVTARLVPAEASGQTFLPQSAETITLEALHRLYPGEAMTASEYWSFLDAVLFRHLLASSDLVTQIQAVNKACQAHSLSELFTHFQVLQTHHEVLFSARLFHALPQQRLFLSLLPAQIIGDPQSGLVVHVMLQAWEGPEQPLLTTAVTLKIGPQHPQLTQ